jgi:hypothetical protein
MTPLTPDSASFEEKDKLPAVDDVTLPKLTAAHGGDHTGDSESSREDPSLFDKRQIPAKYRYIAFSMIVFFATSSSYCEATITPIKSILRKELKITSEMHGGWD